MGGDGILRMQSVELVDFRGINNLTLSFEGKSAVLFGINGVGKSTILKAIELSLAQIISRAVNNQFKQQITTGREDVRFGRRNYTIQVDFVFDDGKCYPYIAGYDKANGKRTLDSRTFNVLLNSFTETYMEDGHMLPVFVSYGVNRAVLDAPVSIRKKHEFGRIETYLNSIGPKTDFRVFFEWFRNQEDYENEQKVQSGDLSYKDVSLEAVRSAITALLPDLSNIRINRSPLRMCATKKGQTLEINQLSDGEKCALAILGDLARRLTLANPHTNTPLLGGGIVLIDEIELHMHPSWQRAIIPTLHKVFPNIQFIITTHSPQVLGELAKDFKVFKLSPFEKDTEALEIVPGYYDSNLVLEEYMDTLSVNENVEKIEKEIFESIQKKAYDDAKNLISHLSSLTNGTHPAITKAQILIRRAEKM